MRYAPFGARSLATIASDVEWDAALSWTFARRSRAQFRRQREVRRLTMRAPDIAVCRSSALSRAATATRSRRRRPQADCRRDSRPARARRLRLRSKALLTRSDREASLYHRQQRLRSLVRVRHTGPVRSEPLRRVARRSLLRSRIALEDAHPNPARGCARSRRFCRHFAVQFALHSQPDRQSGAVGVSLGQDRADTSGQRPHQFRRAGQLFRSTCCSLRSPYECPLASDRCSQVPPLNQTTYRLRERAKRVFRCARAHQRVQVARQQASERALRCHR